MAEPKKETVRIVLPARNDGTPVTSSPRENAMINLPQKPVPVSTPPSSPLPGAPVPPTVSTPMPAPIPGIPKPPSAPGMPKPPSAPGIPKPPSAPGIPKPPGLTVPPAASVPPASPKPLSSAPGSVSFAKPASVVSPVVPAPIPVVGKKETAKVGGGTPTKVLPQATVQFKRPAPSTSKSVSTNAPLVVQKTTEEVTVDEVNPILGAAALVLALAALGVQIWMMVGYKVP